MKIRDVMTRDVIRIDPEESVSVAARTLTHYNIGALPVCGGDGKLCGMLTDRDIVTRCLAAELSPERTAVSQIMTAQVHTVRPDMDAGAAAMLMGRQQVRRLPVVEQGKLRGMVSLGDLASHRESTSAAAGALKDISSSLSVRD